MPNDYSLLEAIEFIAGNVELPSDYEGSLRGWKNLIRTRLNRAGFVIGKRYTRDEILAHAIKNYGRDYFKDYPINAVVSASIQGMSDDTGCSISAYAYGMPGDIESCQALIRELHKEIHQLKETLEERDKIIDGLKPDAESWRIKIVKKNSDNGKIPDEIIKPVHRLN